MKTTLKNIKAMASRCDVEDITYIKFEDAEALRKREGYFSEIAYSVGVYGVTGKVLQGHNTGNLYAITSRTSAVFMF